MGNTLKGQTAPDAADLEADYFRTLVDRVGARLREDGSVDPASVALWRVLAEADDNVRANGGNPETARLARHQQFVEVLEELRLPAEARERLETQYHFQYGDGRRALAEVDGKLGADGLPDPRSLRPNNIEIATANRYRSTVEISGTSTTMRGQLDGLLDDLRIPQESRPELIGKVHADERHFSWIANGRVPAEMGKSGYYLAMVDKSLMAAAALHPPLSPETRTTLLDNAGSWGDRIRDIFRNRGDQYGIDLNYPQADVNRTAIDIGTTMFKKAVEAGYDLSRTDVLKAYCVAVMAQTTEFGHTTQIGSRADGGLEAELGERQLNPSFGRK